MIANGQRRRNSIHSLWAGDAQLTRPSDIRVHVDSFYKALFSPTPRGGAALAPDTWSGAQLVSAEANAALVAPFSEDEVLAAIKCMNPSSAPGPDGLLVSFFKTFWQTVKPEVMALFDEFFTGTMDLE